MIFSQTTGSEVTRQRNSISTYPTCEKGNSSSKVLWDNKSASVWGCLFACLRIGVLLPWQCRPVEMIPHDLGSKQEQRREQRRPATCSEMLKNMDVFTAALLVNMNCHRLARRSCCCRSQLKCDTAWRVSGGNHFAIVGPNCSAVSVIGTSAITSSPIGVVWRRLLWRVSGSVRGDLLGCPRKEARRHWAQARRHWSQIRKHGPRRRLYAPSEGIQFFWPPTPPCFCWPSSIPHLQVG